MAGGQAADTEWNEQAMFSSLNETMLVYYCWKVLLLVTDVQGNVMLPYSKENCTCFNVTAIFICHS